MTLSRKTRKRLALLILLVGLPAYVVAAVTVVGLFERPPFLLELAVYVGLGILWVLPLKPVFLGVGAAGSEAPEASRSCPARPAPSAARKREKVQEENEENGNGKGRAE